MLLSTGITEGIAEGAAHFFDELAKASRKVADDLKTLTSSESPRVSRDELDYDRLANMVAERIESLKKPDESKI